jgi:hypothetical protein
MVKQQQNCTFINRGAEYLSKIKVKAITSLVDQLQQPVGQESGPPWQWTELERSPELTQQSHGKRVPCSDKSPSPFIQNAPPQGLKTHVCIKSWMDETDSIKIFLLQGTLK